MLRTAEHAEVGDGEAAALVAQRQQPPACQTLQPPHHLKAKASSIIATCRQQFPQPSCSELSRLTLQKSEARLPDGSSRALLLNSN